MNEVNWKQITPCLLWLALGLPAGNDYRLWFQIVNMGHISSGWSGVNMGPYLSGIHWWLPLSGFTLRRTSFASIWSGIRAYLICWEREGKEKASNRWQFIFIISRDSNIEQMIDYASNLLKRLFYNKEWRIRTEAPPTRFMEPIPLRFVCFQFIPLLPLCSYPPLQVRRCSRQMVTQSSVSRLWMI